MILANCIDMILFFSTFKNNTSPSGVFGITFKDIDFYGTNYFIYNRGPSITVSHCTHCIVQ